MWFCIVGLYETFSGLMFFVITDLLDHLGEDSSVTEGVIIMPPKKKPLEDARKRLREKLNNVEEQSEYICQFINDLVSKVQEK